MTKKMKIDLLRMEIEGNMPHWLSPASKHSDVADKIRAKGKAKHEADQNAKSAKILAKRKRDRS